MQYALVDPSTLAFKVLPFQVAEWFVVMFLGEGAFWCLVVVMYVSVMKCTLPLCAEGSSATTSANSQKPAG